MDVAQKAPPARRKGDGPPVLRLDGITKAYGPTVANEALSFSIEAGEVVGLIGANGAGKSTLMRILAGVTQPDAGELAFGGKAVDFGRFGPEQARQAGIRIVHQELSLCASLTVAENFYIEQPALARNRLLWRRHYEALASQSLEAIFPASGIDSRARVGDLPIGLRQMLEIARAAADPALRVLILDEPTSSLDARRSADLQRFVGRIAEAGVAVIFISHKLHEVAAIADRVLVLRGGRLLRSATAGELDVSQMIEAMAGEAARDLEAVHRESEEQRATIASPLVQIDAGPFATESVCLAAGEIVGLAGLEGDGQHEFLRALQAAASGRKIRGVEVRAPVAYVSGDRQGEGVFPLWDVIANATIGRIAAGSALSLLRPKSERALATPWLERVRLPPERQRSPVLDLSGGNQQKVLLARALIADADIILLDDPTRGVDLAVKREFYRLIREAAVAGKLIVWHSSETIEFLECGRVLLLHEGVIRRTLAGSALSEDAIVGAAFEARLGDVRQNAATHGPGSSREKLLRAVPFATTALIFALIASLNHNAATLFGLDLLLSAAVPLTLVALGQMFVVGGSEIDLSIGAFAGLTNVLSATALVDRPVLGACFLGLALAGYASLGLLIEVRAIPAIVVTLGASFIWAGIGYALQPTPGGGAPAALSAAAGFHLFSIPASALVIVAAGAIAAWLNASRIGVVLRGFGANARALAQAGWSPRHAALMRYIAGGVFGLLAGLALTAINTASDINAGGPYTLLSIAAVVVGGCSLIGGRIAPGGVVCGALSLSLIGSLLGFLGVSTDYNAAVQGGLLIGILMLRAALARGQP